MLYAPIATKRKRSLVATPEGSTLTGELMDTPAQLRSLRLEALSHFAPLLAGAAVLSCFVIVWALSGHEPLMRLVAWTMLVIACNWLVVRRLETNSLLYMRRDPPKHVLIEAGALSTANIWHEPDASGNLKNSAGLYLLGYKLDTAGNVPTNTSALNLVNVSSLSGKAQATTKLGIQANRRAIDIAAEGLGRFVLGRPTAAGPDRQAGAVRRRPPRGLGDDAGRATMAPCRARDGSRCSWSA